MQCPSCKSDYVQKLRLIYESGTSDIQATSHGSTIGYSTGGGLYTGATTTHTSGQSKTRAAQKASPPEKKRYRLVIVPLLLSWQFLTMKSQGWAYLGWLMIGVACWIVYRAYTYNKKVWPGEYDTWRRSWHCNKCGHIYVN